MGSNGPLSNAKVDVLQSANDQSMFDDIQVKFVSPSAELWTVTAGRGAGEESSPSTVNGPTSGVSQSLNTTIGSHECVAAEMRITLPEDQSRSSVSAFTHQGDIIFNPRFKQRLLEECYKEN